MPKIHPTAIIDSRAQLADDIIVGPYCIIEGDVQIGSGTVLVRHVVLEGPLRIGVRNTIHAFACVGGLPNDRAFGPERESAGTVIGDNNVIREGATIHRATQQTPTTVGSNNYLMCHMHLGHDCVVGDNCNIANSTLCAGHVKIGDNVTIGGNAGLSQFCRVGRLAMLSGMTGITQDIPPFCTSYNKQSVASLNLVGLRRAGLRDHIANLRRAYDLFFNAKTSNKTSLENIRKELSHDPLCVEFVDFIEQSKRGVSPREMRTDYQKSKA